MELYTQAREREMPEIKQRIIQKKKKKYALIIGVTSYKNGRLLQKSHLNSENMISSIITKELGQLVSQEEADRWLVYPQKIWEGKTPIEMIQDGKGIAVLRAVMRLNEGIPA
jgi:uncharacterized protein (DUF2384 family)